MISSVWYLTEHNYVLFIYFFEKTSKCKPTNLFIKQRLKKRKALLQNQYSLRYTKNLKCK